MENEALVRQLLPEHAYQALVEFLDHLLSQWSNVVAVLLTGSYVHGGASKNSDLDIYCILEDSDVRERGNTWLHGVEVEYFINPVRQVEEYFHNERGSSPHTAHMVSHSVTLHSEGKWLEVLRQKAKEELTTPREELSDLGKELVKYGLDDLLKDLYDAQETGDPFVFRLVSSKLTELVLDVFCQVRGSYAQKPKRLTEQLQAIDPVFCKLFGVAVVTNTAEEVEPVVRYVESLIGGSRVKEWTLRTPCTFL